MAAHGDVIESLICSIFPCDAHGHGFQTDGAAIARDASPLLSQSDFKPQQIAKVCKPPTSTVFFLTPSACPLL